MRSPALVAVTDDAQAFESLFVAAAKRSLRVGWLDLAADEPVPASLSGAARAGASKVVVVTPEGAIAWKRRRGAAVLRDVVREQFVGYAVVLVRGRDGLPRLSPANGKLRLETGRGARDLEAPELLSELLRPRYRS